MQDGAALEELLLQACYGTRFRSVPEGGCMVSGFGLGPIGFMLVPQALSPKTINFGPGKPKAFNPKSLSPKILNRPCGLAAAVLVVVVVIVVRVAWSCRVR